jgi:hypothetical protein
LDGMAGIAHSGRPLDTMRLIFEHALDVALGGDEHTEAIAELLGLACHDRSALEAARVRAMGLVMTRPDDEAARQALSLLDEALRRGDERWRWNPHRSFDPWDVVANARSA